MTSDFLGITAPEAISAIERTMQSTRVPGLTTAELCEIAFVLHSLPAAEIAAIYHQSDRSSADLRLGLGAVAKFLEQYH